MGGGLRQSRRAGWDRGGSHDRGRRSGDLQECGENVTVEFTQVCSGESDACVPVFVCVCVFVSHIGGFVGDRAVYVSHRLQDVEGDKANLVEPITTLPPALRRLNHLSSRGVAVKVEKALHGGWVPECTMSTFNCVTVHDE